METAEETILAFPDPTDTNGNISQDPEIGSLQYGNAHLKATSPCRDAGDSAFAVSYATDLDQQLRVEGGFHRYGGG